MKETVRVGTSQACILHGHSKKPGSKTDKPAGSVINCYPFSGEGGRAGAVKKAYAQHYAIQKSQERGEEWDSWESTKVSGMTRLQEIIEVPIEIGDTILTGKFKNHRVEVKEIGTDENGHPTVNGRPILKVRIPKLMEAVMAAEDKQLPPLACGIHFRSKDWKEANAFSLSRRFPMVVIKGDDDEFWVVRPDDGERLAKVGYEYAR